MKRILTALLMTAATLQAQLAPPLVHEIESNFQQVQELPDLELVQGANVRYQVKIKSGGRWFSMAGLTAELDIRSAATSTNQITPPSVTTVTSTTPNYIEFALTGAQTGTAISNWVYSVIIKSGDDQYPLGVGRIDIAASSWTGDAAVLQNNPLNWSLVDAFLNTSTHGPYIYGDGFAIETNGAGRLTITSTAGTWEGIAGKPFTNLVDLTTETLTGVDWSLYATGTPVYTESDPLWAAWLAATPPLYSYTETDPLWSAVSNTVTTGAALGASAYQPADDFDYAWITNPPALFTPTDLPTDYGSDWTTLTSSIAGKQDAGSYVETNDAAYLAAFTNATGGLTIDGRTVDGSAFLQSESDPLALKQYHYGDPDHYVTPAIEFGFSAGTITSYSGTNATVVIPYEIGGVAVTALGEQLFAPGFVGTLSLVTLIAPRSVVSVDNYAFYQCTNLTSVTLPYATSIGALAFVNCLSLTSVALPSATSIGENAFDTCLSLTNVIFSQNAPAESIDVFEGTPANLTVTVTDPQATGWGATWNNRPVVRPGLYADAIAVSGTITGAVVNAGSGSVGGYAIATADPTGNTYILTSAPTVTLTRAYGDDMGLTPTNNVVITMDSSYSTNAPNTLVLGVDLRGTSHTLTFDTNTIYGAESAGFVTTNKLYSFSLHKGWKQTRFEVLKGGEQ